MTDRFQKGAWLMTGRISRLLAFAPLSALLLAPLGGCQSVSKSDYQAAISENEELRGRLVETQQLLEQSEQDKEQLFNENRDLAADLARTEQAASAAPAQQQGAAPGGGVYRGGDVVLTVAGDVLFDSGRTTLKADGRRELDRIARLIMTQYPSNTIRVEGYTDSDPIRRSQWKTNERLSSERALAVEEYLVSRGVDSDRIYAAALGPANPKSSKASSRRVEIVILAQ